MQGFGESRSGMKSPDLCSTGSSATYSTGSRSIPVQSDSRTYDQRQSDIRTSLRESQGGRTPTSVSNTSWSSRTENKMPLTNFNEDWNQEIDRWLEDSNNRWQRRVDSWSTNPTGNRLGYMDKNRFNIEPMSRLTLDKDPFFDRDNFFHRGTLMDRDEHFDDMFRQMESRMNSSMGGDRFSSGFGPGSRSFQQSSHTTVTNQMGRDGQMERKEWSSSSQHDTVNGVTTSRSEKSSSETMGPAGSRSLVASTDASQNQLNFIKDGYEIGADGQLHFKAMFDAKRFHPEDISVTTMDNVMTVTAKLDNRGNNSNGFVTRGECSKQVHLPRLIDHSKFVCNLTQDGILVLDAPVNAPDYSSITFDSDQNLAIRAKSRNPDSNRTTLEIQFDKKPADDRASNASTISQPTMKTDTSSTSSSVSQRMLHLEVPIPSGFNAQDICVSADDAQLYVTAKRDGGEDFKRSFALPRAVDTLGITAELFDRLLIIEAPYY